MKEIKFDQSDSVYNLILSQLDFLSHNFGSWTNFNTCINCLPFY